MAAKVETSKYDLAAMQRSRQPFWPKIGSRWKSRTGGEVEVESVALNPTAGEWYLAYRDAKGESWLISLRKFYAETNGEKNFTHVEG